MFDQVIFHYILIPNKYNYSIVRISSNKSLKGKKLEIFELDLSKLYMTCQFAKSES